MEIQTKDFPDEFTMKFGVSSSFNSQSQFQNGFLSYAGGGMDYLGFDDGSRDQPQAIANVLGGIRSGGRLPSDPGSLIQLGHALKELPQIFTPASGDTPLNRSFDLSIGGRSDIGSESELGYFVAGTYSDKYGIRAGELERKWRTTAFDPSVDSRLRTPNVDYVFDRGTRNISWGSIGNVTFKPTPNQKFSLRTTINMSADDEARVYEGDNQEDLGGLIRAERSRFVSRLMAWGQLAGEHLLFGDHRFDWRATGARANRDEPLLREAIYLEDDGEYFLLDTGESGRYFWSELVDDDLSGEFDYSVPFELGGNDGALKFGAAYRNRTRDFGARRLNWDFTGNSYENIDQALESALIVPNARRRGEFALRDIVEPGDVYGADDRRTAGYVMLDAPMGSALQAIFGVRVENYRLDMISRGESLTSRDQTDVVGSLNLIYTVQDNVKVRAAASRTLDRPEFRELAPFQFTEATSLRQLYGNPDLESAQIISGDLRVDWFPSAGEMLSLGAFYKSMTDPIEQVFIAAASTAYSFQNAKDASVLGLEVDARLGLGRVAESLESFTAQGNYSWIDSEVNVREGVGGFLPTNLVRPLEGQAAYVANLGLNYAATIRSRACSSTASASVSQPRVARDFPTSTSSRGTRWTRTSVSRCRTGLRPRSRPPTCSTRPTCSTSRRTESRSRSVNIESAGRFRSHSPGSSNRTDAVARHRCSRARTIHPWESDEMKRMRLLTLLTVAATASFGLAACDDDEGGTGPTTQAPSAPTNVQLSVNGTSLTITWAAGTNAESYTVTISTPGAADQTQTTTAATLTATFTGLSQGSTYAVQVTAINSAGQASSGVSTILIPEEAPSFEEVTSDILTNTTWTNDRVWVIAQPVFVGRDCGPDGAAADCVQATLTIEPGTTVVGKTDISQGVRGAYLVVSRGSQIIADANANRADKTARPNPEDVIVFTSDKPRGQRAAGDWGGLVINGQAPTNSGNDVLGEGDSGLYGGSDPMDSSGILRGVVVEFAGDDVTPTDQLNGIAPQGVGAGTTMDYIQVHYNVDDGTEPFGGAVSMTHVVLTGIGDDSNDGTDGHTGFLQFVLVQQRGSDADNGFELSNNGDDEAASPHSTAVIANATLIGGNEGSVSGDIAGPEGDVGVTLREGSSHRIYNSIVTGFDDAGFCVEGAQSVVHANNRLAGGTDPTNTLAFENNIIWGNNANGGTPGAGLENFKACSGGYTDAENQTFFNAFNNMLADPGFAASAFDMGSKSSPPDFTLAGMPAGYAAFDLSTVVFDGVTLVAPTDGRTLVSTDYAGAVAPGTAAADAWYAGWTHWSEDGSDSRPNHNGN